MEFGSRGSWFCLTKALKHVAVTCLGQDEATWFNRVQKYKLVLPLVAVVMISGDKNRRLDDDEAQNELPVLHVGRFRKKRFELKENF